LGATPRIGPDALRTTVCGKFRDNGPDFSIRSPPHGGLAFVRDPHFTGTHFHAAGRKLIYDSKAASVKMKMENMAVKKGMTRSKREIDNTCVCSRPGGRSREWREML
jgi:hypothetical protein